MPPISHEERSNVIAIARKRAKLVAESFKAEMIEHRALQLKSATEAAVASQRRSERKAVRIENLNSTPFWTSDQIDTKRRRIENNARAR